MGAYWVRRWDLSPRDQGVVGEKDRFWCLESSRMCGPKFQIHLMPVITCTHFPLLGFLICEINNMNSIL